MIRSDRVATALLTGEFAADVTGAATPLSAADAALTRRSVRAYRDEPVTEAEIARLLTLTGRAPSAFNVQPWRFVVVRDADTKAALREVAYGQKQVTEAPALIVMYADIEDALAHLDEVVHPGLPAEKREATMAAVRNNLGAMPRRRARSGPTRRPTSPSATCCSSRGRRGSTRRRCSASTRRA